MKKKVTIVVKLGTSSICDEVTHEPRLAIMSLIVETLVRLRREGHQIVIVSSAAIAIGLKRMGIAKRPKIMAQTQALAAIGQARLMTLWDDLFRRLDQPVAQILLNRGDIADRTQYLNAQNTLHELLHMNVIPIVNENDSLSVREIKFGDNDTLSAITAGMVNADYLFLMTDVDCLYTGNPRKDPSAKPIHVVEDISKLTVDVSSLGSSVGTGGMTTKLIAAERATSAGVTTIITRSSVPGNIPAIINHIQKLNSGVSTPIHHSTSLHTDYISTDGDDISHSLAAHALIKEYSPLTGAVGKDEEEEKVPLHTQFLPKPHPIKDRQFWILHGLVPHGAIYIDTGAFQAISKPNKAGLLPVGVVGISGHFHAYEAVSLAVIDRKDIDSIDPSSGLVSTKATRVGMAIVNYGSLEIERIMGHQSSEVEEILGYADSEYIADRDNLSLEFRKSGKHIAS